MPRCVKIPFGGNVKSFLLLLVLAQSAFAQTQSMTEKAVNERGRKLVLICYTGQSSVVRACDHVRARVRENCSPDVQVVEIQNADGKSIDSPTPVQVRASLQKARVPRHALVMVLGHAILDYESDPKNPRRVRPVHHLANGKKEDQKTEELLEVVREELDEPSIWLFACHAGMACNRGCIGGLCGEEATADFGEAWGMAYPKDLRRQSGVGLGRRTMSNPQTNKILDLFCSEKAFTAADVGDPAVKGDPREADGILEGDELNGQMCKLPESRRYFDFYLDTHRFAKNGIEPVPQKEQDAQLAGFRKEVEAVLRGEMNHDLRRDWAVWKNQRVRFEAQSAQVGKWNGQIKELNERIAIADKESDQDPDSDALREAFNKLVRQKNTLIDKINGSYFNMDTSYENHALLARYQFMQDEYPDVEATIKGLEVKTFPGEASVSLTVLNPRTRKRVKKDKNMKVRFFLPKPKGQKSCVWTTSEEFAVPDLSRFQLRFQQSAARPRQDRGRGGAKPGEANAAVAHGDSTPESWE